MSTEEQIIPVDEVTRAVIEPDQSGVADDPRGWSVDANAQEGFSVFVYSSNRGDSNDDPDAKLFEGMPWIQAFARLEAEHDSDVALRGLRILKTFDENSDWPTLMAVAHASGYSQSDWADYLVTGPSLEALRTFARTWELWRQGDVWTIEIERFCSVEQEWYSDPDDGGMLSGVIVDYCETDKQIPDEVRANWTVDGKERISPAGHAQLARLAEEERLKELHLGYLGSAELTEDLRLLSDAEPLIQGLAKIAGIELKSLDPSILGAEDE